MLFILENINLLLLDYFDNRYLYAGCDIRSKFCSPDNEFINDSFNNAELFAGIPSTAITENEQILLLKTWQNF